MYRVYGRFSKVYFPRQPMSLGKLKDIHITTVMLKYLLTFLGDDKCYSSPNDHELGSHSLALVYMLYTGLI